MPIASLTVTGEALRKKSARFIRTREPELIRFLNRISHVAYGNRRSDELENAKHYTQLLYNVTRWELEMGSNIYMKGASLFSN